MDIDGEQQEGGTAAAKRRKKASAHCKISRNGHRSRQYFALWLNLVSHYIYLKYFAMEKE